MDRCNKIRPIMAILTQTKRIEKSEEEWKSLLTEEQFYVTRKKGTERAHSSEMCNLFEPGKYACVCCNTVLLTAKKNFKVELGGQFYKPIKENKSIISKMLRLVCIE